MTTLKEIGEKRIKPGKKSGTGRIIGHVAAFFIGGNEVEGGGGMAAGGIVATPETAGLSLGATAVGGAIALHGS